MPDGNQSFVAEAEVPKGLTYCSDAHPGLTRARSGAGFSIRDTHGKAVRDKAVLDRIAHLAIPPAWTDVWICPRASGHIQATGRDVKGRKQYRYHADWNAVRSGNKFDKLSAFARALPKLRARVEHDLGTRGAMGDRFSAKDFRTWVGTVSAARALCDMDAPTSLTDAKKKITVCVKAVAGLLGNTPAVCRSAYVHPAVFELYESGRIAEALPGSETKGFEAALVKLLKV